MSRISEEKDWEEYASYLELAKHDYEMIRRGKYREPNRVVIYIRQNKVFLSVLLLLILGFSAFTINIFMNVSTVPVDEGNSNGKPISEIEQLSQTHYNATKIHFGLDFSGNSIPSYSLNASLAKTTVIPVTEYPEFMWLVTQAAQYLTEIQDTANLLLTRQLLKEYLAQYSLFFENFSLLSDIELVDYLNNISTDDLLWIGLTLNSITFNYADYNLTSHLSSALFVERLYDYIITYRYNNTLQSLVSEWNDFLPKDKTKTSINLSSRTQLLGLWFLLELYTTKVLKPQLYDINQRTLLRFYLDPLIYFFVNRVVTAINITFSYIPSMYSISTKEVASNVQITEKIVTFDQMLALYLFYRTYRMFTDTYEYVYLAFNRILTFFTNFLRNENSAIYSSLNATTLHVLTQSIYTKDQLWGILLLRSSENKGLANQTLQFTLNNLYNSSNGLFVSCSQCPQQNRSYLLYDQILGSFSLNANLDAPIFNYYTILPSYVESSPAAASYGFDFLIITLVVVTLGLFVTHKKRRKGKSYPNV